MKLYLVNAVNGYAVGITPDEQLIVEKLAELKGPHCLSIPYPIRSYKEAQKIVIDLRLHEPGWKTQNFI